MPPFARVDSVKAAQTLRVIPVSGGRFKDSLGAAGHRGAGHQGVDIFSQTDRTVRTAVDSVILRIEDATADKPASSRGAAGPIFVDTVEVDKDRNRGAVVRYLHLDKLADNADLKEGAFVPRGTILGTFWEKTFEGNTGHLHFEVRRSDVKEGKYGVALDPIAWLRGTSDEDRLRTAKLVSLLNQEKAYDALSVGQTVYARSGHRMRVLDKPGYPWTLAVIEDAGRPVGLVTTDVGEAADWTLEQAESEAKYSIRKDGLLGLNGWAYRIRPLKERIAAARQLAPEPRYAEAWEVRKAISLIRDEGFVTSQAKSVTAAASSAATTVQQAAGSVAGGLWDSIPTAVKVGGGIVVAAAVYSAINRR